MSIAHRSTIRGYFLVDVMVGMAIAVVITGVLGALALYQNRQLGAETHRVFARQGLRSAMELMADDLRSAGHRFPGVSYGNAASPPGLCATAPDLLRVTADLDGDGETTGGSEDVTYCRCVWGTTGALYRAYRPTVESGFVVERVADDVSSLQYTYRPREVSVSVTIAVRGPIGSHYQGARSAINLRNVPDRVSCASGPACPPPVCS